MPSLKMYVIQVTHPQTKEVLKFLGQGTTVVEAVTDGVKELGHPFRPKSDGKERGESFMNVVDRDGNPVRRTLKQFEADALAPASVSAPALPGVLDDVTGLF